ncbi:MAG: glycerol-3-phosphate 1-O-acyltransferase PlsY [Erysipelotrichaceae bacterium]|nr:glycerol-3-phosphate 1-O-acyltransferase PlsY [Erysipelotrichaceae bacterium]
MNYLISALIGYLLGSFNTAYLLSKAKGFDIRDKGTHNPGASNVTITLGWKFGIITALFDILKASLAVVIAQTIFKNVENVGLVSGIMAVFGHMYPIYLKFQGGKGFASYIGMILAIDWKFALILMVVCALITIITDYIAIATMFAVIFFPIYYYLYNDISFVFIGLVALSLLIVFKHRKNVINIINGDEIGLRSVGKNKNT